ncbi:hypothetical protein BB2000_1706 [Proteus mirabilis BB2000]|nr:hypothetical protein BB2000_1706 [Proteus mirabilis BB2000]
MLLLVNNTDNNILIGLIFCKTLILQLQFIG